MSQKDESHSQTLWSKQICLQFFKASEICACRFPLTVVYEDANKFSCTATF